jgi:diphthamide synthase subunit DPH2
MSASRRVVSLDIDEQSVAAGTGSAASEAASAGVLAREEGRRLDYLSRVGIEAMSRACQLYERMASSLLERTKALEEVHLAMLDAVREQYLARTQAEIDAMRAEAHNEEEKPDAATSLLEKIITDAARDVEKTKESARKPSK